MREYTHLIANVNGALNKLENGSDKVAKVVKADAAISAGRVGEVQTASEADKAKKVTSAGFGSVVMDMGLTLVRSIDYETGWFVFDYDDHLPDGLYIVVAQANGKNHTRNGVLVVDGASESFCRLSTTSDKHGATLKYFYYDSRRAAFEFLDAEGYGNDTPTGTAYFYKIGTLKKED